MPVIGTLARIAVIACVCCVTRRVLVSIATQAPAFLPLVELPPPTERVPSTRRDLWFPPVVSFHILPD